MIPVTTMDGRSIYLNPTLVEQVEAVPETLITLSSGRKVMVQEPLVVVLKMLRESRGERDLSFIQTQRQWLQVAGDIEQWVFS